MSRFIETIYDLESGQDAIRRRSYGVIEVSEGRLSRIVFRPWPKLFSNDDVTLRGSFSTRGLVRDTCRLYFNQPLAHRNFLALKYIVSHFGTKFATIRRAMRVLDEIARIKRSDAIVAHVASSQISDRLMRRWGWEPHLEDSARRQYIKRFYGVYPSPLPNVASCDRPAVDANFPPG